MNVMSSMVNHLSIISVVQTAIKMEFPTRLTRVLTTLRLVLGLEVQEQCASFDDHDKDGIPNEFDADFVAGSRW